MASITRAEAVGTTIYLVDDAGTRYPALSTGQRAWVLAPSIILGADQTPPTPGTGGEGGSGGTGPVPGSVTAVDRKGVTHAFGAVQLGHAKDIIDSCNKTPNANNHAVYVICLITAIVETGGIWMYSNVRRYPETANYPHDRDGSDSDSVGLYQQRPAAGWGTPRECMDAFYSTQAFLGLKRNRGLFGVPNWQSLTPGTAAQKVQVSAFPDRYDVVVPVAEAIIGALVK